MALTSPRQPERQTTMKTMTSDRDMNARPPLAKSVMLILLGTALLLLVPLVAMQFSKEMNWDLYDFVVAGALLAGTGLLYELAARKLSSPRSRLIAGAVLVFALLLVWAELAVGILH